MTRNKAWQDEVIGVIPAGGRASRISPLPCSKELYPIGFRLAEENGGKRPKVVCHYLLEKMRAAGVRKAYMILREGKWDIPAYLRDGTLSDMHLAYLIMALPFGVPYTLDQAYPFVRDAVVTFGFPDILFQPDDAFVQLLTRQAAGRADVVLGLFPAGQPQKEDGVELDNDGRVRRIAMEPFETHLHHTWGIAVWGPAFTEFMHQDVAARKGSAEGRAELTLGAVIEAAIRHGLQVEAVHVSQDPYLDIGTPERLAEAIRRFADQ